MTTGVDRCTFGIHELEKILKERKIDDLTVKSIVSIFPWDWNCQRKPYRNTLHCIFHAVEKDSSEFLAEFRDELKRMIAEQDEFDFTGFIFPQMGFTSEGDQPIIFSKPILFVGATFQGDAVFDGATFEENALFYGAAFLGEARFSEVTFRKDVYFLGATFQETARFEGATFQESGFENTTFLETAVFDVTTFRETARFDGATFQTARFIEASFQGVARFVEASFQKRADYVEATFQEEAWFVGARFQSALFAKVTFRRTAWFSSAAFQESTWFYDVTFQDTTWFVNSVFLDEVEFRDVVMKLEGVRFVGSPDAPKPNLDRVWLGLSDEQRSRLEHVWGQKLERLRAVVDRGYVSLKMVSFLDSDVMKMRFLNVEWDAKVFRIGRFEVKRSAVRDEMRLYEESPPRNYGAVAALYRALRHNYQRELRYAEAGDFYIGEMEMRRLQISMQRAPSASPSRGLVPLVFAVWGWLQRNLLSPIAWYRNLSLYGESYRLAVFWVIGTIAVFTLIRIGAPQLNPQVLPQPTQLVASSVPDLLDNVFTQSLLAFFQLRSVNTLDNLERVLGAFLSGMLFIALKRRFERR